MDSPAISAFIAQSTLFEGITEEALDMLVNAATCKVFPAGSYLWSLGESNDDMFGLASGRVRASVSSAMGHEFAFVDHEPGAWLGEACLANDLGRVIEAKALVPAEILVINRQVMLAAGNVWPLLYRNLFHHNVKTARGLFVLLQAMAFYPLRARVAGRLQEVALEHGSPVDGGVMLDIKLSQADFARLAVGSRQRVNRIFREWEKSGLVVHRNDLLWIRDMDTLEKEVVPFE